MSKPVPSTTLSALLASMTPPGCLREGLECRVLAYRESIPGGLSGSYVALTGGGRSLQVGLLSDVLGWQSLSRIHEPDAANARDALLETAAELVTRAASGLRAKLTAQAELTLGLPLFVEGNVLVGAATELQAADIVLGSTRALLVVLTPRGSRVDDSTNITPVAPVFGGSSS